MSRATKETGNNPDWYNVIYRDPKTEKGKLGSIRFQQVENLKRQYILKVLKRQYMKFQTLIIMM